MDSSSTHDGLAVGVEGGLDEEGTQGEAQRVVRVPDAGLPAGGARLQHTQETRAFTRPGCDRRCHETSSRHAGPKCCFVPQS